MKHLQRVHDSTPGIFYDGFKRHMITSEATLQFDALGMFPFFFQHPGTFFSSVVVRWGFFICCSLRLTHSDMNAWQNLWRNNVRALYDVPPRINPKSANVCCVKAWPFEVSGWGRHTYLGQSATRLPRSNKKTSAC